MTISCSDYPRIIVGYGRNVLESSFYWPKQFRAPRIGNDASYVTQIIADIHFVWQAQSLVKLECEFRGRRSIWCNSGR